jgi:peptide/nickel transport system permease protein
MKANKAMSEKTKTIADTSGADSGRKRGRIAQRFLNHRLAIAGLVMLSIVVFLAVFAPLLTPYTHDQINLKNKYLTPRAEHILGTDRIGRDLFTRIIYGARVSLTVGVGGVAIAAGIGIVLGGISGYFAGKFDRILLKVSEIVICFPPLILILMLVAIVGQSLRNIILIFGFTGWVGFYRLVRARFLSIREEEFVEALKAFRVKKISIMFKHMLPNTLGPITVSITLSLAGMILREAGLSFLGLGVPPPTPSWGNLMIAAQSIDVVRNHPFVWIAPGLFISITVLSINFIGDGLRDALDPHQLD